VMNVDQYEVASDPQNKSDDLDC